LRRRIRIHDAAAEEAAAAAAWYDRERPGLGAKFQIAIEAALDLLEQDVVPLASMPATAGAYPVQRLILRRFPYSVVVKEHGDELLVVAFAHHSKRPGYWRERLRT